MKSSFYRICIFLAISVCSFFNLVSQQLPEPVTDQLWEVTFESERIAVEWEQEVPTSKTSFTILGQIQNDAESEVIYSKIENTVHIALKSETTNIKEITYSPDRGVNFDFYQENDFPDHNHWQCGGHQDHAEESQGVLQHFEKYTGNSNRRATPEIDLLVLYTTESKNQRGGRAQMETFINSMVASCNATFNRSNANAKIILLDAQETNYRAHGQLITDFRRLVNRTDGHLDEVHTLRAELGADLVLLLTDKDDDGTFGYASIPRGTTGNKNSAFSVCRQATAGGVYPHEIGHNLGCNHNRNSPATTTFPYAFGHFWQNGGETRGSIMSYTGRRSAYFSNPDVRLDGSPTGREDLNDNARTIDNLAPYVAAYFDRPTVIDDRGPEGYTYAVDERQVIDVTYRVDIAYGANGEWEFLTNQTSDVTCNNASFGGDPISGVAKKCYIKEAKGAYDLDPMTIPGTIELENYDRGGAGISYSDADPENRGAAGSNFRTSDGVDIVAGNGSNAIGFISAGEWLNYTVNIQEAGSYDFEFHYSSPNGGGELSLELNDANLVGAISMPATGNWGVFDQTTVQAELPQGEHILKLNVIQNGYNLDKIVTTRSRVTSIEDEFSDDLYVYPNPSRSGIFNLNKSVDWSIMNLQGVTVLEGKGDKVIMNEQDKGVYFLTVNGVSSRLIIH